MRALKLMWVLALVLVMVCYLPAYYNRWKFDAFVQQEAARAGVMRQFKRTLLAEAHNYGVVLKEEGINFSVGEFARRVSVDYRVPVDLNLFEHELAFHTEASAPVLTR